MGNRIDLIFLKKSRYNINVPDVSLHESVARVMFHGTKIIGISRIGKGIKIDDVHVVVTAKKIMDEICADEPGSAGNENGFHDC
jgi:hypothetical protein